MAAELLDEGTLHLPAWRQSLMRQTVTTLCQRQTYRGKSTANSLSKGHEEEEMKSYFKCEKKKIPSLNLFVFPERKRQTYLNFTVSNKQKLQYSTKN